MLRNLLYAVTERKAWHKKRAQRMTASYTYIVFANYTLTRGPWTAMLALIKEEETEQNYLSYLDVEKIF